MFFKLIGLLFIIPIVIVSIKVYKEQAPVERLIALLIGVGLYFLIIGQVT